jgi:hypothetical protein
MAKPAVTACYFALGVASTGVWLLIALLLLWQPAVVTGWFAQPLSGFPEPYSHVGPVVLPVLLIPVGLLLGFSSRSHESPVKVTPNRQVSSRLKNRTRHLGRSALGRG